MLDWIAYNKVWLFAGLGTAIVAAVLGLIKYFFKKPSASTQAERAAGNSVAFQAGGNIQAGGDTVINPLPSQQPPPPTCQQSQELEAVPRAGETLPLVLILQPHDILKEINSRSPYQRQDAANHYTGVHVRVQGKLSSLSRGDKDLVKLYLACQPSPRIAVTFTVGIEKYPELKFIREGADISADGRIEYLDMGLGLLRLADVRICRCS